MLFRWHLGWRRGGGIGFRQVPIYYMPYWRVARAEADRVEYRPSEHTLIHLLGISGIALFVLAVTVWYAGFPWSAGAEENARRVSNDAEATRQAAELQQLADELKRKLPPETVAELERKEAHERRERQEELARIRSRLSLVRGVGRAFHWAAFIAVVAIVVLPLAGFPLQKVVIEKSPDGDLIIRKRGLRPSTRRFPKGAFGRIIYGAEEERTRIRYQRVTIGWMWMVKLEAVPPADRPPSIVDDPEVVFYIDHQKEQPHSAEQRPRSVRQMIKHLKRLTGVTSLGTFETQIEDRGLFRRPRRTIKKSWQDTAVTEQVFSGSGELPDHVRRLIETGATSGDALAGLPDDLRKAIEAQSANGDPPETIVRRSVRLTVRDADGNERTYSSLAEMPPELRTQFEQALRSARRRKKRKA